MAKVKGPLMSMNARGQIGKTLVYSGWKGLGTVRQHVVPSNPKTAGQVEQRDIMRAVVAAYRSNITAVLMKIGWNRAATAGKTIQSGFNAFVQNVVRQCVAWDEANYAKSFELATSSLQVNIVLISAWSSVTAPTKMDLYVGSTQSNMSIVDSQSFTTTAVFAMSFIPPKSFWTIKMTDAETVPNTMSVIGIHTCEEIA